MTTTTSTKKSWIHSKYSNPSQMEQEWAARYNCPYCRAEKPLLTKDGKTDKRLKAKQSLHQCRKCGAEWEWYTHNTTGDRVKTTRLDKPDDPQDRFAGIVVQPNIVLIALLEDILAQLVSERDLNMKFSPRDIKKQLRRLIKLGWAEPYDIVEGSTTYPMVRASDDGRSVYSQREAVPLHTLIVML